MLGAVDCCQVGLTILQHRHDLEAVVIVFTDTAKLGSSELLLFALRHGLDHYLLLRPDYDLVQCHVLNSLVRGLALGVFLTATT